MNSLLRAGKGSALYKYAGVLFHLFASIVLALFLPRVLIADDGTGIICQTLDSIAPNTLKIPYLIEGSRLCFRQPAVDNPATAQTFARPDHVWLWSFLKGHSASIVLPVKHQPEPADYPLLTDSSPASQSIPAILLKESLIPGDLPHRQHRKLGLKIEQALNDRQHLFQQFTHQSYQPMPTVAVSVRNAQVRMVISEEQAPRTINLLSFYRDHLDALIQSYLSLSDDETINKVFREWASGLPASAASSGGDDDDDDNNGSNQSYDDSEPEPLILVYGETIWPAQDSEQRLFSQSLENKRRLLKILKKKLRKAMAGGNVDLIKILNNRIILVDVELGELERSGQSLSPAVLPLFKASFIPDYLEVQRYDEQTLRQTLAEHSTTVNIEPDNLIIPGSSAPRIGRQVPNSGTQKSKGGNASGKKPNTHSQRQPSTMKPGTEGHGEDGNDGDGNHYHNKHTKNNNCPACNNGPCKEKVDEGLPEEAGQLPTPTMSKKSAGAMNSYQKTPGPGNSEVYGGAAKPLALYSVSHYSEQQKINSERGLATLINDNIHPSFRSVPCSGLFSPVRFELVMRSLCESSYQDAFPKTIIGIGSGEGFLEKCFELMGGVNVKCYDRRPSNKFIPVEHAEFPKDIEKVLPDDCSGCVLVSGYPEGCLGLVLSEFIRRGGEMLCTTVEGSLFSDMHQGYEDNPEVLDEGIKELRKKNGEFFQVQLADKSMMGLMRRYIQFYNWPLSVKQSMLESQGLKDLCSSIKFDDLSED